MGLVQSFMRTLSFAVIAFMVALFLLLPLVCAPRAALAQTEASKSHVLINQVDIARFPAVMLYLSVLDPAGKLILGLGPQDFAVKEDEVDQAPIQVQTKLPAISSSLVLDTSGSMKNALNDAQRAAATYIDNVRTDDEVLLIDFSDKVKVAQGFTTDKQAVRNAVRGTKARGNTALYDAIFEATQSFGGRKGRKVIIVLTDGKDDDGTNRPLSVKTAEQVIAAANEVNVPVFTVGLGTSVDEGTLKRIAEQTGGRFFLSPAASDLEKLYKEIGAQLEGQYVVSYTTNLPEADGSWHRVVVAVGGNLGQKQYRAPLDKENSAAPVKPQASREEVKPKSTEAQAVPAKETDQPKINVLAAAQGTRILFATSQYDASTWAAKNLIDEAIGQNRGYASSDNKPQEILLELPQTARISQIIVDPYTNESEDNWAKDIEVWVSNSDPHGEFTKAGAFTLNNTRLESQDPAYSLTEQEFPIAPSQARWVRLLLKSNHGGGYLELGEVKVMGYFTKDQVASPRLRNVLSAESGGKIVYFTSQYDASWAAANLIDGKLGQAHQYASKDNKPAEVVFVLPQLTKVTQLGFNPFTTEDPSNWAKEVEVEVSTEGPRQGFKSVGKFTLRNQQHIDPSQALPDQLFKIDPLDAKFIKLRLISNYGGGFIEMGEFKVFAPAE
jgi:VWFA-related protein